MSFTSWLISALLSFLFWSPLRRWGLVEYFGEAIVIIGVLTEYLAEFHVLQGPDEETKKRRRKLAKVGSLVLLGGLAIELSGLVRTSQISGGIISALNVDVGQAQESADAAAKSAGEAEDSAKGAKDEAKQARTLARAARKETALLKSENAELASRINQESAQLNAITPRSVLLRNAKQILGKAIAAFPGQKATIEICGAPDTGIPINEQALEKADTRHALAEILQGPWGMRHHIPVYWRKCREDRWVGIFIFVNPGGQPKTMDAAQILKKELVSVLPPQQEEVLKRCDLKHCSSEDHEFPGWLAAQNPDLIAVLIGAMPFAPNALKEKQTNKPSVRK